LKRGRKGEKGHRWCRRLGGDRGQSFNNTTVEGKAERNLFGFSAKRGQKKAKKTCSPGGRLGIKKEKRLWKTCNAGV
jgi:hypothetical protein